MDCEGLQNGLLLSHHHHHHNIRYSNENKILKENQYTAHSRRQRWKIRSLSSFFAHRDDSSSEEGRDSVCVCVSKQKIEKSLC